MKNFYPMRRKEKEGKKNSTGEKLFSFRSYLLFEYIVTFTLKKNMISSVFDLPMQRKNKTYLP